MEFLKVWTSFREIIAPLTDEEKGRLFDAMLSYAETGCEPEGFTGNERFLWTVAKQDIDRTAARNETLRNNGLKGGRPKTNADQEKPNETKENQTEAKESCNIKKSNIKKSNIKKSNIKDSSKTNIYPLKRFVPPTVDEIRAYCDERGVYLIDAQYFIDYYEARGWMLTKSRKMVDWKATVRTWEKNERDRARESSVDDIPL